MSSTIPTDQQLAAAPQPALDQLRYHLDPDTRIRARSESQRRLAALLGH